MLAHMTTSIAHNAGHSSTAAVVIVIAASFTFVCVWALARRK